MLKTKTVGQYTVTQMSALEGARLRLYQKQNAAMRAAGLDEILAEVYDEWAVVAACTTPHITREDYTAMPLVDTRPILEAVEEMNADIVTGEPAAVSKKKPETSRKKHTGASANL